MKKILKDIEKEKDLREQVDDISPQGEQIQALKKMIDIIKSTEWEGPKTDAK